MIICTRRSLTRNNLLGPHLFEGVSHRAACVAIDHERAVEGREQGETSVLITILVRVVLLVPEVSPFEGFRSLARVA